MTPTADNQLTRKIDEARRVMEGPEHTQKRILEEQQQTQREERIKIDKRLTEIKLEKEKLEVVWVELDNNRQTVNHGLAPVLVEEKTIEDEENKLEVEEARSVVAQERQNVEKRRGAVQLKRQELERQKWALQENLWQVEAEIESNTRIYRALLDEEDSLGEKIKQLSSSANDGHV